jgi:hypothetical protein
LILAVWIPGGWKVTATIFIVYALMLFFETLSVLKEELEERQK